MLLLERKPSGVAESAEATDGFRMRWRTGDTSQLLDLPHGKTTIGSSPRCNVRIEQPGVHPLHCLIAHEAGRLTVRRWAADTRVNGESFDEAVLNAGDCLKVGSVELVIETIETPQVDSVEHRQDDSPQHCDATYDTGREFAAAVGHSNVWLNDDQRTPWIDDQDPDASRVAADVEKESYRWTPGVQKTVVPFEAAKIVFHELQTAASISRGRSRKLIAALRHNREEYGRLAERVEDLECLMQAALYEHEGMRLFSEESPETDGPEFTILKRSRATSEESDERQFAAVENRAEAEIARLHSELLQIADARQQLAAEKDALAAEIARLREQLGSAERQLATWELAAAEWQRERADWNIERDTWNCQREGFTQEIAAYEARIAEHIRRIESLEQKAAEPRQIESVPENRASQNPFDWSTRRESNSDATRLDDPVASETAATEPRGTGGAWDAMPSPTEWENPDHPKSQSSITPAPADENELSSFAQFSIWNQGAVTPPPREEPAPQSAVEPGRDEQPGVLEPPAATAPKADQTESFIERYAHMFADDAPEAGKSQPIAPPRPAASDDVECQKPRNLGIVRREPGPAPAEGEEESIEQYMAKLLQRVRGDGPRVQASQGIGPGANSPSSESAASNEPQHSSATAKSEPVWPMPSATHADDEQVTTSLGTTRRKVPLAEQSADMEAFRALANESARRAISTHASQKHRRNAVTKAIVATLAGVTSLWMMLEAPHWRDLQFQTACVSLTVAAYWAGQTYRTLIETLRAAAYDGPDDGLKDLVEALRPQLPIDIEK